MIKPLFICRESPGARGEAPGPALVCEGLDAGRGKLPRLGHELLGVKLAPTQNIRNAPASNKSTNEALAPRWRCEVA